jgi:hypothetical protein
MRDLPMIQGVVLVITLAVVLINLLADLLTVLLPQAAYRAPGADDPPYPPRYPPVVATRAQHPCPGGDP